MQIHGMNSPYGLEHHGLEKVASAFWNLEPAKLVEEVIRRSEGEFSDKGEIFVYTGKQTGRCPEAKYLVENDAVNDQPIWWDANKRMSPKVFMHLKQRFASYLENKDIFIQDLFVCSDSTYQNSLRVITESAWSALFASNLFIRPRSPQKKNIAPEITVIHCPNFHPLPEVDGTDTDIVIALDLESKLILIGGTGYAGEIKKSVFTMLNFHLPVKNVLPMHCSANEDIHGNTALFFGLSGTGKTTLSNDKTYKLIGDDEHGWSENGVFNFEGGCYAKTIRLSKKNEPNIWKAARRFGTVLENVSYNQTTRIPDFDSATFTENTRAAYSLEG
ncbi:MAG: phosphoenolpyruvate carboxykinase (ATP), partial [Anaerolineaceae bacterium]